jgi:hypothetical protein
MSFDVEVAADSGIAAPVLGTAAHGRTLHLRASRIEGGRRIHLAGLLDLADLASLERFDPETPDLGTLQEPRIDFVQVAFAGVVDSGGTLEVEIAGAPLALPGWKLSIRPTTRVEDAGKRRRLRRDRPRVCERIDADPDAGRRERRPALFVSPSATVPVRPRRSRGV